MKKQTKNIADGAKSNMALLFPKCGCQLLRSHCFPLTALQGQLRALYPCFSLSGYALTCSENGINKVFPTVDK